MSKACFVFSFWCSRFKDKNFKFQISDFRFQIKGGSYTINHKLSTNNLQLALIQKHHILHVVGVREHINWLNTGYLVNVRH